MSTTYLSVPYIDRYDLFAQSNSLLFTHQADCFHILARVSLSYCTMVLYLCNGNIRSVKNYCYLSQDVDDSRKSISDLLLNHLS